MDGLVQATLRQEQGSSRRQNAWKLAYAPLGSRRGTCSTRTQDLAVVPAADRVRLPTQQDHDPASAAHGDCPAGAPPGRATGRQAASGGSPVEESTSLPDWAIEKCDKKLKFYSYFLPPGACRRRPLHHLALVVLLE